MVLIITQLYYFADDKSHSSESVCDESVCSDKCIGLLDLSVYLNPEPIEPGPASPQGPGGDNREFIEPQQPPRISGNIPVRMESQPNPHFESVVPYNMALELFP